MINSKLSVVSSMWLAVLVIIITVLPCQSQREPSLPINKNSFKQFLRSSISVPSGRAANFRDIYIRFYGYVDSLLAWYGLLLKSPTTRSNVTKPSSFRLKEISRLLDDPRFDMRRPTILYAHGYVELTTDRSVRTVVTSYIQHAGYNTLVLDWANLAFGNYIAVAKDVAAVGKETARAIARLLKQGVPVQGLHFVGHSLGAHVLGYAARSLAARGLKIPRLTGLDPAYPGFYPAFLGQPVSKWDARFVDVIHTDGGGYGAPAGSAHADYWPNGGQAKQPGCLSATVLLTDEDFCSHWRSWAFWSESVTGEDFLARRCDSYDSFLRGRCQAAPLVQMGLKAHTGLKGNFYLRTAAKSPYTLGVAGAS